MTRKAFLSLSWLAIIAAVCILGLAIIMRNIRKILEPPRPPHSASYVVASVPNGASIIVNGGLRGRRVFRITLADIAAPVDGALAEQSRANLEHLAGSHIRVETPRQRLLQSIDLITEEAHDSLRRQEESDSPEATAEPPGLVESRAPIVGVVFGESGSCLNLAQVADGWATCLPSASKEWKREEAKAKKSGKGLWK